MQRQRFSKDLQDRGRYQMIGGSRCILQKLSETNFPRIAVEMQSVATDEKNGERGKYQIPDTLLVENGLLKA